MSSSHSGLDYIWSYSGVLKMIEGVLDISLIIFATLLGASNQSKFLIGTSIYALIGVIVLLIFHIRGVVKNTDFPWFWTEFANSAFLVVLFLIAATWVIFVLTKGSIITGVMGYITVVVYSLDTIEKFQMARTPRARYVWTTPNMPELT